MGGSGASQKQTDEKKDVRGFGITEKKNAFTKETSKESAGMIFGKARPTFHKSEHVGNKGDFPELGVEEKKETPIKASAPIVKVVEAPANVAYKPSFVSNKSESSRREQPITREEPKEPKPQEEVKNEPPKERPRFTGNLKGLLAKQQEDNAESNKNLPELQKKLAETIEIHKAKEPFVKREDGMMQAPREGGISFPSSHDDKKANSDDDDDFDTVEEKKRGDHANKRGGFRGGRGGRGGAHQGEERSERPDRPERQHNEGDQ